MDALRGLDLDVHIYASPNEVPDPIPFARDEVHCAYDAAAVNRFWRVLVQSDRVFKRFRSGFIGKCSPVHLFWGALDLAVTRFSGRTAPEHPGGIPNLPDRVTREAYSHEVSSGGFWAGGGPIAYPAYYAYAYPEPPGFAAASVAPSQAFYSTDLREFILPYDAVRHVGRPRPHAARVPAVDLRRRRGSREVGSRGARVVARLRHGDGRFAHQHPPVPHERGDVGDRQQDAEIDRAAGLAAATTRAPCRCRRRGSC